MCLLQASGVTEEKSFLQKSYPACQAYMAGLVLSIKFDAVCRVFHSLLYVDRRVSLQR